MYLLEGVLYKRMKLLKDTQIIKTIHTYNSYLLKYTFVCYQRIYWTLCAY